VKYLALGMQLVNVSIGSTLTSYASLRVLMVAFDSGTQAAKFSAASERFSAE